MGSRRGSRTYLKDRESRGYARNFEYLTFGVMHLKMCGSKAATVSLSIFYTRKPFRIRYMFQCFLDMLNTCSIENVCDGQNFTKGAEYYSLLCLIQLAIS